MDLYIVLGLAPGAPASEIKRAYRRLSRRYHPDINPGDPTAASLFQRISEAYETLIDPERRRQYDAAGGGRTMAPAGSSRVEFSGFDFSATVHGAQAATFTELFADVLHPLPGADGGRPEPGSDLHATLSVSFVEAMRGVERQVFVTRQDLCGRCGGTGYVRAVEGRCAPCHGTGQVRWTRGHMVFTKSCAACNGTGRQRSERCGVCFGHARHARSEAASVAVPPGTEDGTRLRIPGFGHAGRNGAANGDLFVTVHVQPHPVFRRIGDDLHVVVPVGIHEAVLGARVEVPSLDGPVRLRIPPGTQAGQRVRLRERGVPRPAGGRGDLIAEISVVLPDVPDERSRELVREIGKLYSGDIRKMLNAER
jgi:molecular chaperone DnaJ